MLAAEPKALGKYELSYLVDQYKVDGAYQFLKGMVKGYNSYLKKQHPDLKKQSFASINPYQFGARMAEGKQLLPKGAINAMIQEKKPYEAKAALVLMTDGYNDHVRTQERSTAKRPPEKNR